MLPKNFTKSPAAREKRAPFAASAESPANGADGLHPWTAHACTTGALRPLRQPSVKIGVICGSCNPSADSRRLTQMQDRQRSSPVTQKAVPQGDGGDEPGRGSFAALDRLLLSSAAHRWLRVSVCNTHRRELRKTPAACRPAAPVSDSLRQTANVGSVACR